MALTVGTKVLLIRDGRQFVGEIKQVRVNREREYYIWIEEDNEGVVIPASTQLELV